MTHNRRNPHLAFSVALPSLPSRLEVRKLSSCRARSLRWLLALGLGSTACGGDDVSEPASEVDAGTADIGNGTPDGGNQALDVAPPIFTPCPGGWQQRRDDELGIDVCEPWPDSSPVSWGCPTGWRPANTDGVDTCEPFPEGGAAECDDPYQAHFPGEPGCRVVGAPCPEGDFPEGLPEDVNIVYVQPGFQGGDGSSTAAPLGSLDEVNFRSLPPGSVIALAKGLYRWTGILTREATLWGACPEETVLSSPIPLPTNAPDALVTIRAPGLGSGPDFVVKNLRVSDSSRPGFQVGGRMGLRLEGVIIERATGLGMGALNRGRLFASDLVVRGTRPLPGGLFGIGLTAQEGAQVTIQRAIISRNRTYGVLLGDDGSEQTQLVLEDSMIRDTRSQMTGSVDGIGLQAQGNSRAELRRSYLTRNIEFGVSANGDAELVMEDMVVRDTRSQVSDGLSGSALFVEGRVTATVSQALFDNNQDTTVVAFGDDTRLTLENAVVRSTRGRQVDQTFGRGLQAGRGALVQVRRAVFDRNREGGVLVRGTGSRLVLEDAIVRNTEGSESNGSRGRGLQVEADGRAEVRRVLFARNRETGVRVQGANSYLMLEDVVIRDTRSQASNQTFGRGLDVSLGGLAEVKRTVVARNRDIGLVVADRNSRLILEHAVVSDTQSWAVDLTFGRGLSIDQGGQAEVRRAIFARNRDVSVFVTDSGSNLLLENAVIRDTLHQEANQTFGRALDAQFGARADVRRASIERNLDVGVFAGSATVTLSEVEIDGISFPPCVDAPEPCIGFASGIVSWFGDTVLTLDRTRVNGVEQCGVFLTNDGEMDGADVTLANNAVGACVGIPDFDLNRLGAEFVDNQERAIFDNLPASPEPASRINESGS